MTLVDTSVWIDHFRSGNTQLRRLLISNEVMTHPFVIGELACGSIRNRNEILGLLRKLPAVDVAQDQEVLRFMEDRKLSGRGIGLIDAHLIASALISKARLLTMDKPLGKVLSLLNM